MQKIAQRRRLKRFTEVTGKLGVDRQVRRLAEALDLTGSRRNADDNAKVDVNYLTLFLPMTVSDEEKTERLAELANTVTAVGERSDVILLAMWISPKA